MTCTPSFEGNWWVPGQMPAGPAQCLPSCRHAAMTRPRAHGPPLCMQPPLPRQPRSEALRAHHDQPAWSSGTNASNTLLQRNSQLIREQGHVPPTPHFTACHAACGSRVLPCHAKSCHAMPGLLPPAHDLGNAHDQQCGGNTVGQRWVWHGQVGMAALDGTHGHQRGMAWHGMAWHSTAWHGAAWAAELFEPGAAHGAYMMLRICSAGGARHEWQHLSMAAQRGQHRHAAQALGGQALPDTSGWQQHLPAAPPAVRRLVHPQLWTSDPVKQSD